jgi:N-dimethylarginine dimethylaminohydrolase
MKETCHSEYGQIKSICIKSAIDSFISDQKLHNEWSNLHFLSKPVLAKAASEYQPFEKCISKYSPVIHHFPSNGDTSIDSIYCRDASIATDYGMILCNMGKLNRLSEPAAQREYFEKNGLKILGEINTPGTVEGGDVAWIDEKTLAVGHTYRTNSEGIRQLKSLLEPFGITIIIVDLPHYKGPGDVFHLMSILSPVDKNLAVVYSPLMPISFRNYLLEKGYQLIEVPEKEFDSMGCNVLAIAPRECVMVSGNPITKLALENAGCLVYEYEGNEISVKGGGGPTCLTRPLWRMQ